MLALAVAMPLFGQSSVEVYSEFRRLNAAAQIVEADRGGKPRELLSPAVVRNAWHSFHVVARVPAGFEYALHVVQNPDRLQMRLYKETPDASGVMETLTAYKLSVSGKGGKPDVYLLDLFVPADVPAGRVRVELQLHDGYNWIVYPMEVRVFAAIVPVHPTTGARMAGVSSSDEIARTALREYACGEKAVPMPVGDGVRHVIRRNALQDASLARLLEGRYGREALLAKFVERAGVADLAALCGSARVKSEWGPEWYLRVRDFLFREASR